MCDWLFIYNEPPSISRDASLSIPTVYQSKPPLNLLNEYRLVWNPSEFRVAWDAPIGTSVMRFAFYWQNEIAL